jgi:hypothetical protein
MGAGWWEGAGWWAGAGRRVGVGWRELGDARSWMVGRCY